MFKKFPVLFVHKVMSPRPAVAEKRHGSQGRDRVKVMKKLNRAQFKDLWVILDQLDRKSTR